MAGRPLKKNSYLAAATAHLRVAWPRSGGVVEPVVLLVVFLLVQLRKWQRQRWRQRGGRTDDEVAADIAGDGRAVATKDGRRVGGHQGLR